ncbi:MAG TPA: hypothetical protein VKD22_10150 [Ramlibacter sp.]|nr:hypothetical protein [Ramlibacter sp.]
MPVPERGAPQPAPAITAHADGLPWVRLITGLVALAIFAIPAGRHAGESRTRPIADRVIAVEALPPAQPLPRPILPPHESGDAPTAAPAARQGSSTAQARPVAVAQRKAGRVTAAARHRRRIAGTSHQARVDRHAARATHALTRAQVVREYLAARDQVAALTGEDSGSAWLMRATARRRTARARALVR